MVITDGDYDTNWSSSNSKPIEDIRLLMETLKQERTVGPRMLLITESHAGQMIAASWRRERLLQRFKAATPWLVICAGAAGYLLRDLWTWASGFLSSFGAG